MFHRSLGWDGPRMDGRTVGSYYKKPAKKEIQKFVKLNDRVYASNDLTNFEFEEYAITGNGSKMKLQKLVSKKVVKPLCDKLISGEF